MAKQIWLSGQKGKGKYVLIDDEDYDKLSKYSWTESNQGYAICSKLGLMHRIILNETDRKISIDHIDHNILNNQKINLRKCLNKDNVRYSKSSTGKSKYKGVAPNNNPSKDTLWRAQIMVDRRQIRLGLFKSEMEAALAYDCAARYYFKEFAYLNFPTNTVYSFNLNNLPVPKIKTSKYDWVYYSNRLKKWIYRIKYNKKTYSGSYLTEEAAYSARLNRISELYLKILY